MEIAQDKIRKIKIGIDPGVNTGFAVFDLVTKELELYTFKIHEAFDKIRELKSNIVSVVVENPNLWTHFGNSKDAAAKKQGAGSVKRDYSAWSDFLESEKIEFLGLRPDKNRNAYAYNKDLFFRTTNYTKRCSEHARVAAMLVFNR